MLYNDEMKGNRSLAVKTMSVQLTHYPLAYVAIFKNDMNRINDDFCQQIFVHFLSNRRWSR